MNRRNSVSLKSVEINKSVNIILERNAVVKRGNLMRTEPVKINFMRLPERAEIVYKSGKMKLKDVSEKSEIIKIVFPFIYRIVSVAML